MLEPDRFGGDFVGRARVSPRQRLRRRLWGLGVAIALTTLWRLLRPVSVEPGAAHADVPVGHLLPLEPPQLDLEPYEDVEEGSLGALAVMPSVVEGEIEAGQTLSAALVARGVPGESIQPVVTAMAAVYDFRRSQPGHAFRAELDSTGAITVLRYEVSREVIYEARALAEGGYSAQQVEVVVEVQQKLVSGVVESSLIAAIVAAGQAEPLANAFAGIFQWDIDFSRQVRSGDAFRMLYEEVWVDGEFLRYGRILAAEYRGARASLTAFWYDGEGANPGYYQPSGEALERLFLAAPCRYRRISSPFNPNRLHPVLGVRRPHLGVDYAAATGTPVVAVADGEVLFVGPRGGNGNLVRIRHEHGYESGYAHLSRFARGLRAGDSVEQGQVIGFVGSTGLSTGPHLHFGLKLGGEFIDPLGEQNARAPGLTGRTLRDFQRLQVQLQARLEEARLPEVTRDTSVEVFVTEDLDGFHGGDFE